MLTGNLEDKDAAGDYVYPDFVTTGVHSHDDGVIHWHPYGIGAAGKRAKLGVFLDNYGVELTNDKLVLPKGPDNDPLSKLSWTPASARPNSDDFSFTYEEGEQQCNGKDADAEGRRVDRLPRSALRADVHHRLRRHPVRPQRDGVHDRLRARRHRRR